MKTWGDAKPEGPQLEAESVGGVLEEGQRELPLQQGSLGERCKFPQRGCWRSPGRSEFDAFSVSQNTFGERIFHAKLIVTEANSG